MMHKSRRMLSLALAVLMVISTMACVALPGFTLAGATTDPYAEIRATDVGGGTYEPAENVYFINGAWSTAPAASGAAFTYTYGDGETFGNGVTYRLKWGVNAFKDYGTAYAAVLAQNETWAADPAAASGAAVMVFAPGSQGSISGYTDYALPEGVTDPTPEQMFHITQLGPQAGKSPVSDDRSSDDAALAVQNNRTNNTGTEYVLTSTYWQSKNAYVTVDGFAAKGGLKIHGPGTADTYAALIIKNFYAANLASSNSAGWQVFQIGGNAKNSIFHITDFYLNYNGVYVQTAAPVIYGNDILFEHGVITGPSVESTTDQYHQNQHISLYPNAKASASANFYGDKAENPLMQIKNVAIVNWNGAHVFRLRLNTASNWQTYSGNAVRVEFDDNYVSNVGNLKGGCDMWYIDKPGADAAAAAKGNASLTFAMRNNYFYYPKDLTDNKVGNLYLMNTVGNPGAAPQLANGVFKTEIYGNTIIGDVYNSKFDTFYSCVGTIDLSGNLFLDLENNVQEMTASYVGSGYTNNYNVLEDIYASDEMQGGVRELFSIRQVNGGVNATAAYCNIVNKRVNSTAAKPYFTGYLTVVLRDGATFHANDFISYRNKNVKYLGMFEDEACTSPVTVFDKDSVDGLFAKAEYRGKETVCTVIYKINTPKRYNFLVPEGVLTTTFNGATYTATSVGSAGTAVNGITPYFYNTYTAAYSGHDNPSTISGGMNGVIVVTPGEYDFSSQSMGKSVCVLGPNFGRSPYDAALAENGQYANGRSFDPATEGILNGYLNVAADASLSYVFDGLCACGSKAYSGSGGTTIVNEYQTVVIANAMIRTTANENPIFNCGTSAISTPKTTDLTVRDVIFEGVDRTGTTTATGFLINARANFVTVEHLGVFNDIAVNASGTPTHMRMLYLGIRDSKTDRCKPAQLYCDFRNNTFYNSNRDGVLLSLRENSTANANFSGYPSGYEFNVSGNKMIGLRNTAYLCGVQSAEDDADANFITMRVENNYLKSDDGIYLISNYQSKDSGKKLKCLSDDSVIRGNVMDSEKPTVFLMYEGNHVNVDENSFAVNTADDGWHIAGINSNSHGYVKSDWWYVGEKKNTDFIVSNDKFQNVVRGVNTYNTIAFTAVERLTKSSFNVPTGSSVTGIYDAGRNEISLIEDSGTYFIAVRNGSDLLYTKATITVDLPCEHRWTHEVVTLEPTCGVPGTKDVVCDDKCGEIIQKDVEIPATGLHTPSGTWTVKTPPTCVDEGEEIMICTVCHQEVDSRPILATGIHTPAAEWIRTKEPDCLNNGVEELHCSVCNGLLDTRSVQSTGEHNFISEVLSPASCTVDGSVKYTCTGCHTTHTEVIPKTGHQYKAEVTKTATCVEDGVMTYTCSVCHDFYTEPIPSNGSHNWSDWQITQSSTCTVAGSRRHTCTRCGTTETEDLPLAAHIYDTEFTVDVHPTGTVRGEKSRHCLICGARTDITDMGFCTHEHIGEDWIIDVEATCTVVGSKHQICLDCGDEVNVTPIEKLPHDYHRTALLTPAGCTTDGEEEITCSVCNSVTTRTVPATGHTIGKWTVITPATCTTAGSEQRFCTVCSEVLATRSVPATGHKNFSWIVQTPATCTEEGEKVHACAECGYFDEVEVIPATGHSETYRNIQAPTCTEAGVREYTCQICGNVRVENVEATGHTPSAWRVVKPATSLAAGERQKICTVCGAIVKKEVIAKLDTINSALKFKDVNEKDWFKPAVDFAVSNGLFAGTTETTFSPNMPMSRAMIVTVLGRIDGVDPKDYKVCQFQDVKDGSYYYSYVEWARQKGIVSGIDRVTFAPDRDITRQEICKVMVDFCKYRGIALRKDNAAVTFKDAAQIAKWARPYVDTCQRAGIISGSNGYVKPLASATRAEGAAIFMSFYKNYM